jgi:chromosomal replication initiator protein
MDSRKLWQAVLGELEVSVSRASFSTWFKDTAIIDHEGGHITVAVPNIFTKEWLEKKFHQNIKASLAGMGMTITSITYKVATRPQASLPVEAAPKTPHRQPEASRIARAAFAVAATGTMVERPQPVAPAANPTQPTAVHQLNTRYTLDAFVVGSSNELAYAASAAVVKFPGSKYNPLFLYGGVGLGKTHLMQAIGNELLRRDPSCRVRYVSSEQFTNEFIDSVQHKRTKSFAQTYRNLDVLIVDDIQFIGNKEKTQEEFFHTFNALHQAGKQIIMSSDKPPRAIPHLEARLRSRFEMGMSADIQRPDLETRAAIIQRKALLEGASLPVELVEFLAREYQHNIRELEGALTQLIAYCEVRGIEPSVTVAKGLSGGGSTGTRRKTLTPKAIIEKTASYFDLLPADIIGSKRDKEIVVPRQIAMYLMRSELNLSYPKIAAEIGKRDHTTAIHSVRKIEKLLELEDELRSEVNRIKERISL